MSKLKAGDLVVCIEPGRTEYGPSWRELKKGCAYTISEVKDAQDGIQAVGVKEMLDSKPYLNPRRFVKIEI